MERQRDRKTEKGEVETERLRYKETEGRRGGKTERRRDEGTTDGIVPLPRRLSFSPSLCLSVYAVSTVFSTAAARVVSRVPVVDCENSTSFDHRQARSGLRHRTDVDQGENPVGAQRQQVARAV